MLLKYGREFITRRILSALLILTSFHRFSLLPDMSFLAASGINLCEIAAATPPHGLKSNFVDPPTFAPAVIAVSVILMTSAILFTTGRLFANRKELTWSDCRFID